MLNDPDLLSQIESLHDKIAHMAAKTSKPDQKERAQYAADYMAALAATASARAPVFGIEPWHPLDSGITDAPGEMLLRVKDVNGKALSPYPAVMIFYHNGFTTELDTILCLCALAQYRMGADKKVSINISGRSLQDPHFVKHVLTKMETLDLGGDRGIIFEIHESNAVVKLNPKTLALFKKFGVEFAMDDVGLSMNDVFRLSSFENIADYIKLDRASVSAHPEDPRSLKHILSLARSLLPHAAMVAEGIRSAEHACDIRAIHPDIKYVQGMHLPGRDTFRTQWAALE